MPPRESGDALDPLRRAVQERVNNSSLRQVAKEVGLSHPAVRDFLNGTTPRKSNVAKLRKWFEGDEVLSLRREVAELKKRIAELERQLREAKR